MEASDPEDDADDPLTRSQVALRALQFFGWLLSFMLSMAVIGLIPTTPLFIIAFMRLQGRERWSLTLRHAFATTLFVWAVFDQLLHVLWPPTLLGPYLPELAQIVPSL